MNILDKARLLQTSILSTLIMGVGGVAYAQTAEVEQIPAPVVDEAEDEDTIIVTGSRIRRSIDSTTPVTEIEAVQIEKRAFTNVIDAINDIPLVSGSSTNQGANTQFGDNNAFANLLNLGTNRTLTLVDGQRMVGSNQATIFTPGNAPGAQVDLTIINPSLVERTELQTVGGGAVYGADAVSGVINIILKDDFEGFDITAQAGATEFGDGDNYRISGAWGKNFLDGRANLTLAGEYLDADIIRGGGDRGFSANQIVGITNPLSLNGEDGVTSTLFQNGVVNPLIPNGGLLVPNTTFSGGTNNLIFPNFVSQTGQANAFRDFVAETGQSPFEFINSQAGAGVNPLLFLGTFGNTNLLPTVANPDVTTSAFLPRLAVPLGFSRNGNLAPFSFGNILPPNRADQNSVVGGNGFANPSLTNLVSGQERISFNALLRFDITDNITYKGNFMYADIENTSIGGNLTNAGNGGATTGARAIPVYIDQNPFLNSQARGVISSLVTNDGLVLPQLNGLDALFLSRNLADITGERFSGNASETFRTAHSLDTEFELFDRQFTWDADFVYGRNTSDNNGSPQLLDIEFALAVDAVVDPVTGETVCHQQTLAAPQDIGIRNPGVARVNTGLDNRTPTAAQVAACVPLNLFGEGVASQAAIDYVSTTDPSRNESEQLYAATSLGGDIIELPAGNFKFNVQAEYRKEELEFIPGQSFALGLGRNTLGRGTQGALEFVEYGGELFLPVFGGDFTPIPFIQRLELEGALRVSERSQETEAAFADTPTVSDTIYTVGGRWSPYNDLTIRGLKATSVRSASIVELFGAPQTGFTSFGSFNHPCDEDNIGGGPDGGVRAANCATAVNLLGLAPDTLDGLQIGFSGRPAATGGNPFLQNEQADSWTAGVAWQPSFIPGFSVEADWISIDIAGVAGLTSPLNLCFDSPDFPNANVGGTPVCDQLVFNVEDPANPGSFIVPGVNPLTGGALPSPAAADIIGSTASPDEEFNFAFIQFPQLNQGGQKFRGINATARYNFDIGKYGDIGLVGTLFYVNRNDISGNGQFTDTNPAAGEPGNAKYQSRIDVNHNYGKFTHQLQWFRTHATVDNATIDENLDDQSPIFRNPDLNVFNYNVSYEFTDNITGRFIANNITREEPQARFGVAGVNGGVGRTFAVAVNARF